MLPVLLSSTFSSTTAIWLEMHFNPFGHSRQHHIPRSQENVWATLSVGPWSQDMVRLSSFDQTLAQASWGSSSALALGLDQGSGSRCLTSRR